MLYFVAKHLLLNYPLTLYVCVASGVSENWEAVDAQSPKSDSRFYLNVCHKVLQSGAAAVCPMNASICAVGKSLLKEVHCCSFMRLNGCHEL